jgi:hypothetical protein
MNFGQRFGQQLQGSWFDNPTDTPNLIVLEEFEKLTIFDNMLYSNRAVDLKFYLEILKNWLSYLPYNQRSPSRDTF